MTTDLHQIRAQVVDAMDKVEQAWNEQGPVNPEWLSTIRASTDSFLLRAQSYAAWQKKQYGADGRTQEL